MEYGEGGKRKEEKELKDALTACILKNKKLAAWTGCKNHNDLSAGEERL